jgi:hypothetical protein
MPQALAPQGIKGNGEFIPMTAHVGKYSVNASEEKSG